MKDNGNSIKRTFKANQVFSFKPSSYISESELFEMGWRRFGDHEDDPYYSIYLKPEVFGLQVLNGNFTENGSFKIFSIHNKEFHYISQLQKLFKVCGFVINWELMNH